MHRIVQLSEAERHRLIHDFVDSTYGAQLVELLRAAVPDLPDEPTAEQVECWIELAELVQNTDFRVSVRRMAEYQAAERADGDQTGLHHELTNHVADRVAAAIADGVQPASAQAAPVVAELVARYADTFGATDSGEYRAKLSIRLAIANDPRVERYWNLIATINGSSTTTSLAPVFTWFTEALQHHPEP